MSSTINVQPTPNPNALKFILANPVKSEGKAFFKSPADCPDINLAQALFDLRGVDQIHFFDNVITVNKFSFEDWEVLEPAILTCLENNLEGHDPHFTFQTPEEKKRENLGPELSKIEDILDKRIRPGLQGDGGDLVVQGYKENVLLIKYQGACGSCPSSTAGTLEAIKGILREEYNPDIEVYIAPEI